jgi:hypothetical protein
MPTLNIDQAMTPEEARGVLVECDDPRRIARALYVLGRSVAAEKDGRPRLPMTAPKPKPEPASEAPRLYGPDGLDESGWEKAMVGQSALAAAIGEPAEADPTPHPALAALSDDPTEAVEIDEWLCGPVASRPGQTRLAAGDVCTVREEDGSWEVSFSANDGDVREALHDETARRFDERAQADAYHAELVERFASVAAKSDRDGEPTIYGIAAEQAAKDDALLGGGPVDDGMSREEAEGIVATPAAYDPETVKAATRKLNAVPVAFATLLALVPFAAGQQATGAHVQTEDAASKTRQARHILLGAVDGNDPGDPFEGRVTEPAGVPRAARPFGEEVA